MQVFKKDLGTLYTSAYDHFGLLRDLDFCDASYDTIPRYQYDHDKHGNRLFARATQADAGGSHDNDRSWRYAYDGLNRLIGADYGSLTANNSAIVDAYANRSTWQLDNLGNWSGGSSDDSFTSNVDTDGDGVEDQTFTLHHNTDLSNAIDTLIANSSPITFINDRAGNLIFDGALVYRYDAWNRLVSVQEIGTATFDANGHIEDPGDLGAPVATLRYGPLGRLITYENDTVTEHYYYDGVRRIQTIEDNGVALSTQAEYVYGPDYIDEFILQTQNTGTSFQTFYMLRDANYNVVALTNESGQVIEQYAWEPYGTQAAMDTLATPAPDNRVGHQGLFYYSLGNSGLYYNRNRWYAPHHGRFPQMDPRETRQTLAGLDNQGCMECNSGCGTSPCTPGGTSELMWSLNPHVFTEEGLNRYQYLNSNPLIQTDPSGEIGLVSYLSRVLVGESGRGNYDRNALAIGAKAGALLGGLLLWYAIDFEAIMVDLFTRERTRKGNCLCFSSGSPDNPDWTNFYKYGKCIDTVECNERCVAKGYLFGICSFR